MLFVQQNEIFYQLTGDLWINFIAFLQELVLIYLSPYNFLTKIFKCTCEAYWDLGSFALYK